MRALLIPAFGAVEEVEQNGLDDLRRLVEGDIEALPMRDREDANAYVNEAGTARWAAPERASDRPARLADRRPGSPLRLRRRDRRADRDPRRPCPDSARGEHPHRPGPGLMARGNPDNLRAAAQRKRQAATQRAETALDALIASDEPITFRGLAKTAGVSIDFLYRGLPSSGAEMRGFG